MCAFFVLLDSGRYGKPVSLSSTSETRGQEDGSSMMLVYYTWANSINNQRSLLEGVFLRSRATLSSGVWACYMPLQRWLDRSLRCLP